MCGGGGDVIDRIDRIDGGWSGGGDVGGEARGEGALDEIRDDGGAGGALEVGDGVEVFEEGEVVVGDVFGAEGDFAFGSLGHGAGD